MKIGQVSKQTNIPVQTIRYYESQELIQSLGRTEGNFRIYDNQVIDQLKFIKHCRLLDLSLGDIKRINELRTNSHAPCHEVDEMIIDQIKQVKVKMQELKQLETQLKALSNSCTQSRKVSDCGIIKYLQESY
ncbi:MerR family transcriptional regulator [Marinicella gelatinilytica]|uniref:MerR family transcriptional regulator n=1 Tax=Marinicella gelatinilytica TaxID=2996017 RepID=UPI0022609D01|nr:MerR family DNA-binding protein [Marinicella gelatinilytica]MCX7543878.1 MerR family transcriptional regulator [Marinicella gelatinilytica]